VTALTFTPRYLGHDDPADLPTVDRLDLMVRLSVSIRRSLAGFDGVAFFDMPPAALVMVGDSAGIGWLITWSWSRVSDCRFAGSLDDVSGWAGQF